MAVDVCGIERELDKSVSVQAVDGEKVLYAIAELVVQTKSDVAALASQVGGHFPPNRPLSKDEAAEYLGINPDTLCKWARAGRIAYCRLGEGSRAPMRFRKQDLDAFLSACRVPTVEEVASR